MFIQVESAQTNSAWLVNSDEISTIRPYGDGCIITMNNGKEVVAMESFGQFTKRLLSALAE